MRYFILFIGLIIGGAGAVAYFSPDVLGDLFDADEAFVSMFGIGGLVIGGGLFLAAIIRVIKSK